MTRIVLFLTAVPLAAILALVLNHLLERAARRRQALKSLVFLTSGGLWLILTSTAPVAADTKPADSLCASIESSLSVDRQELDELWSNGTPRKVKLLYQSRIPVTEQTLVGDGGTVLVDERGRRRPPAGSSGEAAKASLDAPRS